MLQALGGDKSKLVIDLSCRRRGDDAWFVAMNKWQTITDMEINQGASVWAFPPGWDTSKSLAPFFGDRMRP